MSDAKMLQLVSLEKAVAGDAVAIRSITRLQPAGGPGDKVFPPTYEGGEYAEETRVIDGERLPCVLLDSVQSQANRLEMALLEWYRDCEDGKKPFPLIQVDFSGTAVGEVGIFTALEAPHRIADGVFLACELDKKPFRHPKDPKKSSVHGQKLETASAATATPIFELCPTALLFGMWDSHGARGGLGEKFQRVLVSEIIGVDAVSGKRPASRIDPLIKTTADMPIEKLDDGSWRRVEKGKMKLSEVGLGNVTPSLRNPNTGNLNHGGVTIRFAGQNTVLSLPALRRLRFPVSQNGKTQVNEQANLAARTTLAALGLAAVACQWPNGFSLRSRCDLVPESPELRFDVLYPGRVEAFTLNRESAFALVIDASKKAVKAGLPWSTQPITLKPNAELIKVVKESRDKASKGDS